MSPHSTFDGDQSPFSSPITCQSSILHPNIHLETPPKVVSARGIYLHLDDGREILEASGGPGVACIGHGNSEVADAVRKQMQKCSYCFALYYSNPATEELANLVIASTNGVMARATVMSSGK